tara:strand:+ start:228 stop:554 length:327 start_codon:yes stop_codon:yes gene_type:complete
MIVGVYVTIKVDLTEMKATIDSRQVFVDQSIDTTGIVSVHGTQIAILEVRQTESSRYFEKFSDVIEKNTIALANLGTTIIVAAAKYEAVEKRLDRLEVEINNVKQPGE